MNRDTKKYHQGLKKYVALMNNINDKIKERCRKILNHREIIEHLFYKPINKYNNLVDALDSCQDYPLRKVKLDNSQVMEIECLFMEHLKCTEEYEDRYRILLKGIDKYIKITNKEFNLDRLVYEPKLSKKIDDISEILDGINVAHTKNWSFQISDKHVDANKIRPYNFIGKLSVDIFGCIRNAQNNALIYFAIDIGSDKLTTGDYLKQFSMCQMNICWLRINKDKIEKQINNFLDIIVESKEYVAVCNLSIKQLGRHSNSNNTKIKLEKFYVDYQYNHTIYMKYYDKKVDADEEIGVELESNESSEELTLREPADESYIVSDDFIRSLTQK